MRALLFLALVSLVTPADADACGRRRPYVSAEQAAQLVAAAEKAVAEGAHGAVLAEQDYSAHDWHDAGLRERFFALRNVAKLRGEHDWKGFLEAHWADVRDAGKYSPLLAARYAEARSRGWKTDRARALAVLEGLAAQDLLTEPEAWAALARLRAAAGDEAGAMAAAERCRGMTKREGVCP